MSSTSHRSRLCVLHDVNFHAPAGSLTCVYGEVGSGKSSLLLVRRGFETLLFAVPKSLRCAHATLAVPDLCSRPFSVSW
jgi:ABC-type glutathione transport system ATPase component